jgi:hypothetical protein
MSLGLNLAIKAAIDPHRPFDMNLALQDNPFSQEGNIVVPGKVATLHASSSLHNQ